MTRYGYQFLTVGGRNKAQLHGMQPHKKRSRERYTMKKEELIALGLTEEQASSVLSINGKDIEHAKSVKDKDITTLTTERDDLRSRLTTAEETISKFGGKTPEQIAQELADYKKKAEDAQADFDRKITQRDQKDWLKDKLDAYGVASPYARKQLEAEVMAGDTGLTWKDGAFFGFDDFMKSAKEKDPGLYQTEEEKKAADEQKKLEDGKPTFTGPSDPPAKGKEKPAPPVIF